jgi:hypothetical protein
VAWGGGGGVFGAPPPTPSKTGNCHPERSEGSLVKTVIGNKVRNPFIMSVLYKSVIGSVTK